LRAKSEVGADGNRAGPRWLARSPETRYQARRQLPRRLLKARPKVWRRFNQAVLKAIYIKDGKAKPEFKEGFDEPHRVA
ncbi:MAG: hypothetical protein ABR585_14720, partial [Gemmatimonadaceae bacterium]